MQTLQQTKIEGEKMRSEDHSLFGEKQSSAISLKHASQQTKSYKDLYVTMNIQLS